MKTLKLGLLTFLVICNIFFLYGIWLSTDDGFTIDDPTAGIMCYRYEESWKWNPNPPLFVSLFISMLIISIAFTVLVVTEWIGKLNNKVKS